MKEDFSKAVANICSNGKLTSEVKEVFYYAPVEFNKDCVAAVRRAAERLGLSHRDIVSGAGHDACYIARVAPTSMVFCPCVDGISHHEEEKIHPDWATAGADVLFHAVVETTEIVE
jgi:N-carbamoyl-L-amino-acid hydrolase